MMKQEKWVVFIAIVLVIVIGIYYFFFQAEKDELVTDKNNSEDKNNIADNEGSDVAIYPVKCPAVTTVRKIEKETIYSNQNIGFELTIPEGWYIPSQGDTSPNFYLCLREDEFPEGLAISNHFQVMGGDNPFGPLNTSLEWYEEAKRYYASSTKDEKELSNLIPGAVVKEYKAESEGEKAPYSYYIIYDNEKASFFFASTNPIEEYSFITSFRLK